jgi:hypothetical protein
VSLSNQTGAEQLGKIVLDFTCLKSQKDKYLKTEDGDTFWCIEFDLCIIIDGLNLRFEARSPENPDEVQSSKTFSIAASFQPGTA